MENKEKVKKTIGIVSILLAVVAIVIIVFMFISAMISTTVVVKDKVYYHYSENEIIGKVTVEDEYTVKGEGIFYSIKVTNVENIKDEYRDEISKKDYEKYVGDYDAIKISRIDYGIIILNGGSSYYPEKVSKGIFPWSEEDDYFNIDDLRKLAEREYLYQSYSRIPDEVELVGEWDLRPLY